MELGWRVAGQSPSPQTVIIADKGIKIAVRMESGRAVTPPQTVIIADRG